jgi:hypothetical protein
VKRNALELILMCYVTFSILFSCCGNGASDNSLTVTVSVALISLTATGDTNSVTISWHTASDVNPIQYLTGKRQCG